MANLRSYYRGSNQATSVPSGRDVNAMAYISALINAENEYKRQQFAAARAAAQPVGPTLGGVSAPQSTTAMRAAALRQERPAYVPRTPNAIVDQQGNYVTPGVAYGGESPVMSAASMNSTGVAGRISNAATANGTRQGVLNNGSSMLTDPGLAGYARNSQSGIVARTPAELARRVADNTATSEEMDAWYSIPEDQRAEALDAGLSISDEG